MEYPVRTDVEFRSVSKTISQLSSLSRFVQIKISIPFTATGYSTILLNINPFHKFCRCFARISFIKLQRTRNTTVLRALPSTYYCSLSFKYLLESKDRIYLKFYSPQIRVDYPNTFSINNIS